MRSLYNPLPHVLLRLVTGVFGVMMPLAALQAARESPLHGLVALALGGVPLGLGIAVVWNTRTVRASDKTVEIGGFAAPVPMADVASFERPGWAVNPTFAPLRLALRDGRRVLFFPSPDAEAFLKSAGVPGI